MNQPYPPQHQGFAGRPGQPPPAPPYAQPVQPPVHGYAQPAQPPQAYAPQGQPAQAPAGGGATGIALNVKYHPLAFMLSFFKPVIVLNGQQFQGRWGRMELPLPPGQHQLHVHVPYLIPSQIGKADTFVPVAPGQVVEAEYRAPVWTFSQGSLGPVPQTYNGVGAMVAVTGGLLLFFFLVAILPFLL